MTREIKLLNFNLTKINVEKNPDYKGQLSIKSNMKILSIEKYKIDLIKKESVKINFNFSINYEELGLISLDGFFILLVDKKTFKELIEKWDSKDFNPDLRASILNIIIQKSSIQALKIEEEIGLPLHIQMPQVNVEKKQESK